jgi:hypothetical protein
MNYQIRFTDSKNLINCPTYDIAMEMLVDYQEAEIGCYIVEMEV